MKTIPIEGELRERLGKGGARSLRRDGRIPAVLYGQGKSFNLTVDRKQFVRAMQEAHGENVIFDVRVPGESAPLKSIAREIQHDPVSRAAVHVDFQHIDLTAKIHVSVAIRLVGEPDGVKNFGGILERPAREVEILCLPADIPASIDVDVSRMLIGDTLHVSDIVAGKFEFQGDPAKVVAHVAAPTVEKEPVAEVAVAGVTPEGEAAAPVEGAPEAEAKDEEEQDKREKKEKKEKK
ncbi:MAG: 50S ribosomal protein L25 [bacterium]